MTTIANFEAKGMVATAVDAATEQLLDFLARTVRRESVTGYEDTVAGLYAEFFEARGWPALVQPLSETAAATAQGTTSTEPRVDARANILGYYRHCRPGTPVVVLNGHIDVVPVLDEAQWDHPPYSGVREDGSVHGRGSVDTKGGIAAALYALAALDEADVELPFDVAVELVVGEETTGVGTRAALEHIPTRLGTIVLEPTDGAVVTVASGLLFFTVEVTGRAAHTSVPWHGVDVGPKVIEIYQALSRLGDERSARLTHARMPFPSAVPLAIGTVDIGGWRAAVPARGSLSGRIGVMPGEDFDAVRQALAECVDQVAAQDPWLVEHPPRIRWDNQGLASWETPDADPVVHALNEGRLRTGLPPKMEGMTAGCDAGILRTAGISTAVFGPGDMRFAHSPNEKIAEHDVVEATHILANALLTWAEDVREPSV